MSNDGGVTKADFDAFENRLRERIEKSEAAIAAGFLELMEKRDGRVLEHIGKTETRLLEHMERSDTALETRLLEHMERSDTALETRLLEHMERSDTALQTSLLERMEKQETTMLREFRKWSISFESRFKANQVLVEGFSERMASLEERVSDLERRD